MFPRLRRRPTSERTGKPTAPKRTKVAATYLLTASTVLGAIITLRAELLTVEARDSWARAARAEANRDDFVASRTNYVLNFIGYHKFSEWEATLLRDKLRQYAGRTEGRVHADLVAAARVQSLALDFARNMLIIGRLKNDAYLTTPHLYSYADHLASTFDGYILPSPSRNQLLGNDLAYRAMRTMYLTFAAAIAFMLAVLAIAFDRMRRPLVWCSTVALAMTTMSFAGLILWSA
jgi:hypothetical protein